MKRTVLLTALCILLGSSAAIFAHPFHIPPPRGLGNFPRFHLPEIRVPDIHRSAADMSVYEQFGLSYNQGKNGYCYNGKLIGLFVDRQGRGITFLNSNSEVHVKAVRDNSGKLTGIEELSANEYSEIVAEMDARRADINVRLEQHMKEVNEKLEQQMSEMNARVHERMNRLRPPIINMDN